MPDGVIEAAANAAAQTAAVVEGAAATVDAVIDAANERVAQAEATAEEIAAAAMESARGQEIAALRQEIGECREQNRNLSISCDQLAAQVTDLSGQLQSLLTLEIIRAAMQGSLKAPASPPPPGSSSSTPPNLAEVEAAATTAAAELNPENLSAVAEAVQPVAVAPVRRTKIRL